MRCTLIVDQTTYLLQPVIILNVVEFLITFEAWAKLATMVSVCAIGNTF